MIQAFKNWFFSRDLKEALLETKKIKVNGVLFEIKRLDIINVLEGSKVLLSSYQTYEDNRTKPAKEKLEKDLKIHYRDVFLSSVIKPKLSRKEDGKSICVDDIFTDFNLAENLYKEIMQYTYGKKKLATMVRSI